MLDREFSSVGWQSLEGGLRLLSLRQQVLSNNVANANTPGFKRSDVPFQQIMQQFISSQGTAQPATPLIRREGGSSIKPDGNNVDIDSEMVQLAENNLIYQAAIRQLNMRINHLRLSISEGRKG